MKKVLFLAAPFAWFVAALLGLVILFSTVGGTAQATACTLSALSTTKTTFFQGISHHDYNDAFLERELWRGGALHLADLTGRRQRTAHELRDSRRCDGRRDGGDHLRPGPARQAVPLGRYRSRGL